MPSQLVSAAVHATIDATVRRIEHPTPTLALLTLELPSGSGFTFQPGQFTMVHAPLATGVKRRAYSIASPPGWLPRLDLAVSLANPNGVSGWLLARKPGGHVALGPGRGKFTLSESGRPAVFRATGTGIAPFRAMLHDQWDCGHEPEAWLFVGASTAQGLPYHAEMDELRHRHERFHYVPVVSRPAPSWEGVTGRIQMPLIARFDGRTDFDAYICGAPDMVQETIGILERQGLPREQLRQERYA